MLQNIAYENGVESGFMCVLPSLCAASLRLNRTTFLVRFGVFRNVAAVSCRRLWFGFCPRSGLTKRSLGMTAFLGTLASARGIIERPFFA